MGVDFQLLSWLRTLAPKSEPWHPPPPTPGLQSSQTQWFLAGKMDAEPRHFKRDCGRLRDWGILGMTGVMKSPHPHPNPCLPQMLIWCLKLRGTALPSQTHLKQYSIRSAALD